MQQRKPSKLDAVIGALGAEIARGTIPVGASLPSEGELEARFGVSRGVVREATKILSAKGLVRIGPRHGTIVLPRSAWSLLDRNVLLWLARDGDVDRELLFFLEEARAIIEPQAAGLAALRARDEDRACIAKALADMQQATDNPEAAVAADKRFHLAILAATHNPVLHSLSGAIDSILSAVFAVAIGDPDWFRANLPNHEAVASAIVSGDRDGARLAMQAVVEQTRDNLASLNPTPAPSVLIAAS